MTNLQKGSVVVQAKQPHGGNSHGSPVSTRALALELFLSGGEQVFEVRTLQRCEHSGNPRAVAAADITEVFLC